MFGDAVRHGLVDTSPFNELRLAGSRGRKDIVALTEHELHELAEVAVDERMELGADYDKEYRAMVLFAGYVGLRSRRAVRAAPRRREGTAVHDRALTVADRRNRPHENRSPAHGYSAAASTRRAARHAAASVRPPVHEPCGSDVDAAVAPSLLVTSASARRPSGLGLLRTASHGGDPFA